MRLRHTSHITHLTSHGVFWFRRQNSFQGPRLIQNGFQKHKVLKHLHPTKGLHFYLILRKALEGEREKKDRILNWALKTPVCGLWLAAYYQKVKVVGC